MYPTNPEVSGTVASHSSPIVIEKVTTVSGVIGTIINITAINVRPV